MTLPSIAKQRSLRSVKIGLVFILAAILIAVIAPLDVLQLPMAALWSAGLLCILLAGPIYWFSPKK